MKQIEKKISRIKMLKKSSATTLLDHNNICILHPIFTSNDSKDGTRIMNYIENIISCYDKIDFIMNFHLLREITYDLISKCSMSKIFTHLQRILVLL